MPCNISPEHLQIIETHLSMIASESARQAYRFLIDFISSRSDVTACVPTGREQNRKKEVTITITNGRYFSFSANKSNLLFYFRLKDRNPFRSAINRLDEQGFVVDHEPNPESEATVRIATE